MDYTDFSQVPIILNVTQLAKVFGISKNTAYDLIHSNRIEQIDCFEDIKRLFLEELEYLVDNNPLYIRLESMRAAILERNTDQEVLLRMKTHLFERMEAWVTQLSQSGILTSQQLVEIFFLKAAIVTGCKLGADHLIRYVRFSTSPACLEPSVISSRML